MSIDRATQPFRGFRSPNYTQVPDELFDELLSVLSGAELKVLLYIIRRTFGFKRDADAISLSQMLNGITTRDGDRLDRGVGLSKPTLLQALRSLETNNIIETQRQRSTERGDEPTIYQLRFVTDDAHIPNSAPVVKKLDQGVVKKPNPPVVKKSAPQETGLQQTEISLSNIRESTRSIHKNVDNSTSQSVTPYRTVSPDPHTRRFDIVPTPVAMTIGSNENNTPADISGLESVGEVLKRGRGRPRKYSDEVSQTILNYVTDFAREFADKATVNQSAARFINDFYKWGRGDMDAFVGILYQARSITKSQGGIRGSKFAYFCSVVEDLLGLRESTAEAYAPK